MTDVPPDDITAESRPQLSSDQATVNKSQIGRLQARHVELNRSQAGMTLADNVHASHSSLGFVVARNLDAADVEAGAVVAFNVKGTVNAQVDARSIVAGAAVFAIVLAVLGRLLRRS